MFSSLWHATIHNSVSTKHMKGNRGNPKKEENNLPNHWMRFELTFSLVGNRMIYTIFRMLQILLAA
jgi:hypothetical protein